MNVTYKVMASGAVRAYANKKLCSSFALELSPSLAARKQLREQIPSGIVRAAWIIFGSKCHPADINEIVDNWNWVGPVLEDSPKALPVVWRLACRGNAFLSVKEPKTLIKRAKCLLTRTEDSDLARISRGRHRKELDEFWRYHRNEEPLTDGAWRWLVTRSFKELRLVESRQSSVQYDLHTLNVLSANKAACLTRDALELGRILSKQRAQFERLATAFFKTEGPIFEVDAETMDFLRDASYERNGLNIAEGASWKTIVRDAYELAARRVDLQRKVLEGQKWESPLPEVNISVNGQAYKATALTTGEALLEEGYSMKNCLRDTSSYAERGIQGLSLVYSLQGPARTTVELFRGDVSSPWEIAQVARSCNQQIREGADWTAAELLALRLNDTSQGFSKEAGPWALAA